MATAEAAPERHAVTAEGARGETAAEMGKVLRFPEAARRIGDDAQLLPWNTGLIHAGMAWLNGRFQSQADTPYEIDVANAVYGEKTFPFSSDFVATIGKFYGTGVVVPVDFINAPEVARLRINAWAEEKTRGRIKDLVPPGAVTTASLRAWLGALEARDIDVALPRFRIETSSTMNEPLRSLGMRKAFSDGANFDGLVAAGSAGLFISDVFHKAFVEVTEQGTEAAAATAVLVGRTSAPMIQSFTPAVRAERPFLFAIRDVQTGALLFLGRMTDPTGTAVPAK